MDWSWIYDIDKKHKILVESVVVTNPLTGTSYLHDTGCNPYDDNFEDDGDMLGLANGYNGLGEDICEGFMLLL